MYSVLIRFYEELNFFLKSGDKHCDIPVTFSGKRSVKDLIESLGVPHVEVDLILVNGNAVSFEYIVQNDDRISVYPEFEAFNISTVSPLRAEPLRQTRFVVDVHLHVLARKLRMLGFDTDYEKYRDDPVLAEISDKEKRILLTRDRQLLMRKNISRGLYVRNTLPELQIREVIQRLDLYDDIKPFSRCIQCNTPIQLLRQESDIYKTLSNKIPEEVKSWCSRYSYCPECEKIYWRGKHVEKMEQFIETLNRGSLNRKGESAPSENGQGSCGPHIPGRPRRESP